MMQHPIPSSLPPAPPPPPLPPATAEYNGAPVRADPTLLRVQDLFLFHWQPPGFRWQPPGSREPLRPEIPAHPPLNREGQPVAGLMTQIPLLPTANRLSSPEQPEQPFQLRSGRLYWLELPQARVLSLPAQSGDPSGIVGPYDHNQNFPYAGPTPYGQALLAAMLQLPEPPEVIALLAPPQHKPYRYFLTERARFLIRRITQYGNFDHGMGEVPRPFPELWADPERQPSPAAAAQRRILVQRLLPELAEKEKSEARHLQDFLRQPPPNKAAGKGAKAYTRSLNQSRRELKESLAEKAQKAAQAAERHRQEIAYWQARAALPENPRLWIEYIRERILPDLRRKLLTAAYRPAANNQPRVFMTPRRLREDSTEELIQAWTEEILLWEREAQLLEQSPAGRKAAETPTAAETPAAIPAPGRTNSPLFRELAPPPRGRQKAAGRGPTPPRILSPQDSPARETIAESRALEGEIRKQALSPAITLRRLDADLLPAIIAREYAALRQLQIDRDIAAGNAAAAAPQQSWWQEKLKREKQFREYWTARRPELLAAAQEAPEYREISWPPPPPLPPRSPALDPQRHPELCSLQAGKLLIPAPGGGTDYWWNAGIALRPDPESQYPKNAPFATAYHLVEQDAGWILGRLNLEKNPGRNAGKNWNGYDARNSMTFTGYSPETFLEHAANGARAALARLRARRQLKRLEILQRPLTEVIQLLGLELVKTPALPPSKQEALLRRRRDQEILWQLEQHESSQSEFQIAKSSVSWRALPPGETYPSYTAEDQESLLRRLLAESLAAGQTEGGALPTELLLTDQLPPAAAAENPPGRRETPPEIPAAG